jgi:hypothetical protein
VFVGKVGADSSRSTAAASTATRALPDRPAQSALSRPVPPLLLCVSSDHLASGLTDLEHRIDEEARV